MKCDNCKKDSSPAELVLDHLLPRSHARYNFDENMRLVHLHCTIKQPWYKRIWQRIVRVFRSWQAARQLEQEINKKLIALTDPTFLDRALRGQ